MLSYWEQQSFLHYGHIVVGAGIVGLSTAIELKSRFPNDSVLVLERGLLPTGASSRNAGFACMGSLTELIDDAQHSAPDELVTLYARRKQGLELLRQRLGDDRIGYRERGSYELLGEHELSALEQLDYYNDLLKPITGQPAFKRADERIAGFGFAIDFTKALIENTCEGELHAGKMLRALTHYALQQGVELKTGAEVTHYEEDTDTVRVHLRDPFRKEELVLQCDTMSICTNAFTRTLLPDADVMPGRGQVLITQPIASLPFKGIFHFDRGYYYFREIDGRVLLGGGRHLDIAGETTTDFSLTEAIQLDLESKLKDIIIPGVHYHIEQRWSGIMAFGISKRPVVQAYSQRIFGAFRMGGMGVALGSAVAKDLAIIIAETRA